MRVFIDGMKYVAGRAVEIMPTAVTDRLLPGIARGKNYGKSPNPAEAGVMDSSVKGPLLRVISGTSRVAEEGVPRSVTSRPAPAMRKDKSLVPIADALRPSVRRGIYQQTFQPTYASRYTNTGWPVAKVAIQILSDHRVLASLAVKHLDARDIYNILIDDPRMTMYLSDITEIIDATNNGEETWLRRIADAFVACHLILQNSNTKDKAVPLFSNQEDYFPFYYALKGGMRVADTLGRKGFVLKEYFGMFLGKLQDCYLRESKCELPIFNDDVLFGLPRTWVRTLFTRSLMDWESPVSIDLKMMPASQEWKTPAPDLTSYTLGEGADVLAAGQARREWLESINRRNGIMSRHFLSRPGREAMLGREGVLGEAPRSHRMTTSVMSSYGYETMMVGVRAYAARLASRVLGVDDVPVISRELEIRSLQIVQSSGATIYIPCASIDRAVELGEKAMRQGRQVMRGMAHTGLGDIPYGFVTDGGTRMVARRLMGEMPPQRFVFMPARMTLLDRPAASGDYYTDAMGRALALYQRLEGLKRRRPKEVETDFPMGTRSKVGGIGVLKRGSAKLIAQHFQPGFRLQDIPLRQVDASVGLDAIVPSHLGDLKKGAVARPSVISTRISYIDPVKFYHAFVSDHLQGQPPQNGTEWASLQHYVETEMVQAEYRMLTALMLQALADQHFPDSSRLPDHLHDTARRTYDEYVARYAEPLALLRDRGEKQLAARASLKVRHVLDGVEGLVNMDVVEWCAKHRTGYDFVRELFYFLQTDGSILLGWDGTGEIPRFTPRATEI